MSERVRSDELLSCLPLEWPEDLSPEIRTAVRESGKKIVVLDDDPTGTQTVCGVPVLTEWSVQSLCEAISEPEPVLYILTNSRSIPLDQARAINHSIAANLSLARQHTGRDFVVISRSDSTLRGHFPGEVLALIDSLKGTIDGVLIIPFFLEGGRLTINNVHYVLENDCLVPAAETEYARDLNFGYKSSNLQEWVSEKYRGLVRPEQVVSVTLSDLRKGGPKAVEAILDHLHESQNCIVNSASYRDIEVFVLGLLQSEAKGKRFLYRTAASFVRVRGGIQSGQLLRSIDLQGYNHHPVGLIVVGSYTQKTTDQIQALAGRADIETIEVGVENLFKADAREAEINRAIQVADQANELGKIPLIYTSRQLIVSDRYEGTLEVGQEISSALVAIVRGISVRPAWLIAKGGITSSDIATKGLNVRRAQVLGQAIPGIPIWRTGAESRWPDLVYVIFPGNVGTQESLLDMVKILQGAGDQK